MYYDSKPVLTNGYKMFDLETYFKVKIYKPNKNI